MSDDFKKKDNIYLQPGDATVPYTFTFAACSSATANDGSIPYDTLLSAVTVTVFDAAGADKTSEIVATESNTTLVETVWLKYPATAGAGRYSLEMLVTLDSGTVMEFDFTRLYATDISAAR